MSDGYDLDSSTPAAIELQNDYARRSEEAARNPGAKLDLAYGSHERHRLDVFSAGPQAPVLVFFHGGYWMFGSKDSRRFPATEWNARGVSWVVVNYRLMPEHTLTEAITDARAAVAWLSNNADDLGLDPSRLHLTGNSAGAHLAAMAAAADWRNDGNRPDGIASLSVVSGLFDLEPLINSKVNDGLALTADAAFAASPIHHLPDSGPQVTVCFGGAETQAFADQSLAYAKACRENGNEVTLFDSPGANHFEIINEYGTPGSPLFGRLVAVVLGPKPSQSSSVNRKEE